MDFPLELLRRGAVLLATAVLSGCLTAPQDLVRVGSYNIRLSGSAKHCADAGTPNTWESRKADLVALVKRLDLDAFGMQEVCPDQAAYLREQLPEFALIPRGQSPLREIAPPHLMKNDFKLPLVGLGTCGSSTGSSGTCRGIRSGTPIRMRGSGARLPRRGSGSSSA